MQINVALSENNVEQAAIIRSAFYPNTTAKQTRDAFIFNECIDRYNCSADELLSIIEEDNDKTQQRMLTIKADSNERLKTIAACIGKSIAATYRAIIKYTIENLSSEKADFSKVKTDSEAAKVSQFLLVSEKVELLEQQLKACSVTMKEIKKLLEVK